MIIIPNGLTIDPVFLDELPDQIAVAYYTDSGVTWEWVDDENDIWAHMFACPGCRVALYRCPGGWEMLARSGWKVH